jgi:hypothetical protein
MQESYRFNRSCGYTFFMVTVASWECAVNFDMARVEQVIVFQMRSTGLFKEL